MESGERPPATVFEEPPPRRQAPEPVRRTQPVVPVAVGAPAPGTVEGVRRVLARGGAPEALAGQVAAVLGEAAEERLRADPWQLLRVGGVRPEQADGFARALLGPECGPGDERRGRAVTVWLLEQAALAGHTALEMPALTAALAQRGVPDPDGAVQGALAEGDALAFQDGLEESGEETEGAGADEGAERPVRVLVGLERYALAEESLADGLARLINSAPGEDGSGEAWERAAAGARGAAAEVIRAAAGHGLVLHTGGDASRAETAELVRAARRIGLRAWAAAHSPVGRERFATLVGGAGTAGGAVTGSAPVAGPEGGPAAVGGPGARAGMAGGPDAGPEGGPATAGGTAIGAAPVAGPEARADAARGPDAGQATVGRPEAGSVAGGGPDAGQATVGRPEAGSVAGGGPDAGQATVGRPEAGSVAGGGPDAGQATVGRPEAGSVAGGGPDAGQATVGRPEAGSVAGGGPDAGQATVGRPEAGSVASGGPDAGQATVGRPEAGSVASGGPDAGQAASGGPEAGVVTVAGLLSGVEGPGRDADGALDLDLLVVLDAPQLDVETGALLVESLSDGARLVLAGDPGVLWSVGPGRVFADLLAVRACPHVASRRPDPGPLGELVSGVGVGELLQVEAPGKEVVIVPVRDAGEAVHRTVQLVADSVPRAIGVPPEQTVVITPGHGGAAGTRVLNAALKERLNPGPGRFGGFDPGDRVAYSPAPGRTLPGRVVGADAEGLHLSCAGDALVVPKERVEQSVRHGWALTAHQAAGAHWPAVVAVLPGDAAQALSRPWVYTAFGRAERHLSVVHGVEQALPRAVAEVPAKPRTTRLPLLLAAQVPAGG
ncbi:hypothetical protein GCM10020295_66850 [Streptomyces cinereospinus]